MTDTFKGHSQNLIAPPASAVEVTPSDSTDLTFATRAIYVGTAGNLRVKMLDGTTITLTNVQAGCQYALRVDRVLATGTSATGIIAFW